jgi:hypothetical protein
VRRFHSSFFILNSAFVFTARAVRKDFPAARFAGFSPGPGFFAALTPNRVALNFPA